ncbi:unnamed protein product [Soboliphyme baturini]|uniref:Phosphatidylinositol-3-phosphatase SAC1 n=1 Tax=Soboliphyme baturini TaxID=241478 RepID=A0A183IN13_9BILA|nr:unnamed protein product [Soboliphyme baturini]
MKIKVGFRYITPDRFIFEPCTADGSVKGEAGLVIDRVSQEIEVHLLDEKPSLTKPRLVYGIFGIIHLTAGPYLIVITSAICVGTISQHKIYKVTSTEVLPYVHTLLHLNEVQMEDNTLFLNMLNMVLSFKNFYYSTSFDITHSLQRLNNTSPEFRTMPLLERADLRFTWNYHLMKDLIESAQTRGIDNEGNAANFVETEQILEYGDILCSFVQTRGSIPLCWSQKPNLRWQPWPKLKSDYDHLKTFRYHMASQFYTYGYQVIVSLLDQCGREKDIAAAFEKVFSDANLSGFKFVNFDFHKECKNMNWSRLNGLIDSVKDDINRFGYFVSKKNDPGYCKQQEGVFRTNCIDCLDRTNVVQSLLAKYVLESQLKVRYDVRCSGCLTFLLFSQWLQILTDMDSIENHSSFSAAYKNCNASSETRFAFLTAFPFVNLSLLVWADNGNACSVQYAGTGALKDDFTRFDNFSMFLRNLPFRS